MKSLCDNMSCPSLPTSPSDKLLPIPRSKLSTLRDQLFVDYPRHLAGHSLILNLCEWFEQTPTIEHLDVLSLNGDWTTDGLFLVTVSTNAIELHSRSITLPLSTNPTSNRYSPLCRTCATCLSTA